MDSLIRIFRPLPLRLISNKTDLMMKTLKPLFIIVAAILFASQASAALKLYYSTGELISGLGQASSNTFTNTIIPVVTTGASRR